MVPNRVIFNNLARTCVLLRKTLMPNLYLVWERWPWFYITKFKVFSCVWSQERLSSLPTHQKLCENGKWPLKWEVGQLLLTRVPIFEATITFHPQSSCNRKTCKKRHAERQDSLWRVYISSQLDGRFPLERLYLRSTWWHNIAFFNFVQPHHWVHLSSLLEGRNCFSDMRHEEEEDEEEKWLNVASFATQCVEDVGLSSDRYNRAPHGKKKRPQRVAPSGGSKDKLTMVACENKRKRDLWNADSALILWNNISVLVGHFERYLWVLVPLHPSVLQEDNVRFALMGQQSERMEDFPLLFNVNVAMACCILPLCSLCLLLESSDRSVRVVGQHWS